MSKVYLPKPLNRVRDRVEFMCDQEEQEVNDIKEMTIESPNTTEYIDVRLRVNRVLSDIGLFSAKILDPLEANLIREKFNSPWLDTDNVTFIKSSPVTVNPNDTIFCQIHLDDKNKKFVAEHIAIIDSYDEKRELKLLSQIPRVGRATAEKILKECKTRLGDTPVNLFLSDGLGFIDQLKCVNNAIKDNMRTFFAENEKKIRHQFLYRTLFLSGFSNEENERINTRLGLEATYEALHINPYALNSDYNMRVDSYTLDRLAMKFCDIEREDSRRINFFFSEILADATKEEGHLFLGENEFLSRANYVIGERAGVKKDLKENLQKYLNTGEIIMTDDGNIYTYKSKIVEDSIAENLKDKLTRRPFKIDSQAVILQIEAEKGIELSKEQLRAVECALNSNVSVITGGAGTGKTQTIEMIVKSFLRVDKNLKIALLAPTGKAARRMKEATGLFSQTIHRYLGYSKDGTLDRLSHKDSDVVIVDEASMVDVELFYNLLRSIEKDSKLVLVGDENQIEPVGAGKVLKDLIDSNHITHTRLKEVFRQREGSKIKDYSKRINIGEKIKDNIRTDRDPKDEFFIFNLTQTQEILYIMKREIERRLKDGTGINDIQVLSATKRGPLGTINLNSIIQKEFNKNSKADKPKFIKNQEKLYVGDKVVQNVNNYKLGVMNGEIGYYEGEDNGKYIFNFYGEEIEYEEEDLEELNLAYAITVHKSQGSEFDTVIFVVNDEDEMVTNKSIVYTAWTRAKNKLYTIGDIEYLDERLDSKYTINRNTALKEKLIA